MAHRTLRRQPPAPSPDRAPLPDGSAAATRIAELERELADLRAGHGRRLDELDRRVASGAGLVDDSTPTTAPFSTPFSTPFSKPFPAPFPAPTTPRPAPGVSDPTDVLRRQLQVWTFSRWLVLTDPQVEARVSVVLATHDHRSSLRAAIASVLDQRRVELQLVVVDDASTDGTAALLKDIGDDRLTVLRLDEPVGPAAARNAGLEAVTRQHRCLPRRRHPDGARLAAGRGVGVRTLAVGAAALRRAPPRGRGGHAGRRAFRRVAAVPRVPRLRPPTARAHRLPRAEHGRAPGRPVGLAVRPGAALVLRLGGAAAGHGAARAAGAARRRLRPAGRPRPEQRR